MTYLDRTDYAGRYIVKASSLAIRGVFADRAVLELSAQPVLSDAAIDAAIDNAALSLLGALPSELRN